MNIVHFGEGACEKIRRYLDSYVSSELLVETNHEVLRHLEGCPGCAAELEMRTRLRSRLKGAVEQQPVPPELATKIREKIRRQSSTKIFDPSRSGWLIAVAAALVVAVGVWTMAFRRPAIPTLAEFPGRPAQDELIRKVSAAVSAVFRIGLGDHIHCSVFRKYPQNPPALDQMTKSLGPSYSGLLAVVQAGAPTPYRVIMAHQCGYAGRRFVHLTLRNGSDLVSLVMTRKQPGESLGAALSPALQPYGIPVYRSAAEPFQVAGFETDQYLAFVVSGLAPKTNLQIAANLAPAVHAFLLKTQS